MSNVPVPVRASVPRPSPLAVAPHARQRQRIESLPDADFDLVEEPRPTVPRPTARPGSARPVSSRISSEDLLPTLFGHMQDLELLEDALEGARFCLDVLAEAIPTRAGLVHLYDATRRSFLVVSARGEAREGMLLSRQDARDPLLRVLLPKGRPFTWTNLEGLSVAQLGRFAELSHIRSVMAAPVSIGHRWLGVIELVDKADGDDAFRIAEENGLAYVADRYAAFLSTRGVIVDIAAVARFALGT